MNDKYVITISGKPFVLYAGLLEESHKRGIQSLEVEITQYPKEENEFTCICKSTLESKDNQVFIDYGDANPKNVSGKILPHYIRMACTRAKARVMRDFCNIGICSFEELDLEDIEALEKPSENQIALIKRLSIETNTSINLDKLDKAAASTLIAQLMQKRKVVDLKQAK